MEKRKKENDNGTALLGDPFGQRFPSVAAAVGAKKDWLLSRHSPEFWEELRRLKEQH